MTAKGRDRALGEKLVAQAMFEQIITVRPEGRRSPAKPRIAPLDEVFTADGQSRRFQSPLDWHFLFVEAGSGAISIDRTETCFEAGSLICIPPSATCNIALDRGIRGTAVVIDEVMFRSHILSVLPGNQKRDSSFWRKYYSLRVLNHSPGSQNCDVRRNICDELETLARHLGKGGDPAIIGSALVILFGGLQKQPMQDDHAEMTATEALAKSNLVIAFRTLVEQHFAERLKVGDYARLLGVTPRTLLRACQAMTGQKVVAVIHDRLMLEATRLLRHSNQSISEISYSLGFEDTGYFSRFIKAHAGHCPIEVRRSF